MDQNILILGASGQIGSELTFKLRASYPNKKVIASDIKEGNTELMGSGLFEQVDATDKDAITAVIKKYQIAEVYHMAAMLSAIAEEFPEKAWNLNMGSLLNVLDLAKEGVIQKVFWPSSIAIFGPTTPKQFTAQTTIKEPTTVYGISKLAGEQWCAYYKNKFKVDVRSVRYPGIISWKTKPGGGTTDYAVDIFHGALSENKYTSFLNKDTRLPMMYMDDAIRATISLMEAPEPTEFYAYNISAMDFTPQEIAASIKNYMPDFEITYQPDSRQEIADSWPQSIDDSKARMDWQWVPEFDLDRTTQDMLKNLKEMYSR